MKRGLFLLLLVCVSLHSSAQPLRHAIDSLRTQLAQAKDDPTRAGLLAELGSWYYSVNADSALLLGRQAVELAQKTNNLRLELRCRLFLAETVGEQNIPESMRMTFAVLQQAERIKEWAIVRRCYIGIGLLHLFLENYSQTIAYTKRARQIGLTDGYTQDAARLNAEIGSAFLMLNQPDSARNYFATAIREEPSLEQDPYLLYYRGDLEGRTNPALARRLFERSIQRFKSLQDGRGLALASRWYSELLGRLQQFDSSILVAKQGLRAAQQVGILRPVLSNSRQLAQLYGMLGQIDSAYKYQTIMLTARDSLFSQQKFNQIQTTLIDEQQRIQVLQDAKTQFENNVKMYGLLGLVVVALGIAGLLYRNDRQKQRANRELQTLNEAIGEQKEEIETQRDHLEQTLTELQTTQAQLIQKEKLASLGELTAGIAHEIQNPLNFVNNFSEVSTELVAEQKEALVNGELEEAGFIADDLSSNLQKIHHHGGRAAAIVRGMLEHSRIDSGEKRPTDLNALAEEYLKIAYHGLRAKDKTFNCELVTQFDPNLGRVEVVPQEIGRVLLNLFNNAFYAVQQRQLLAEAGYQPTVSVFTKLLDDRVEICVSDNGTGIPNAVKAKIFQPFFTTKPTGEGTGLGLSLSYDIVTKGHGGTIKLESTVGEGSLFVISLPAVKTTIL